MDEISGYNRELVILIRAIECSIASSPVYARELIKDIDFKYLKWVGNELEINLETPIHALWEDSFILSLDREIPKKGIFRDLRITTNCSGDSSKYVGILDIISTQDLEIFSPGSNDALWEKVLFSRILCSVSKNIFELFCRSHGERRILLVDSLLL